MTATDTRIVLAVDLDLKPACHWCPGVATWAITCEATPPRPLGEHGCCGARIYRAGWRPL